ARGAPLERRCAVAGSQQIVRAEVHLFGAQFAKFGQQLPAMLHVGVVRLVRSEEPPDGLQLTLQLAGIHAEGHRKGFRSRAGSHPESAQQCEDGKREVMFHEWIGRELTRESPFPNNPCGRARSSVADKRLEPITKTGTPNDS